MAHKDRRVRKMRGSQTYGYGGRQKHRGKGSRGGIGMGGGKKHKWYRTSKDMPDHFGHKGFKRYILISRDDRTINVGYLEEHIQSIIAEGLASKKGNAYSVDLTKGGYDKLLGSGKVTLKLNVKVGSCSARAREKIEKAQGTVEAAAAGKQTQETKTKNEDLED